MNVEKKNLQESVYTKLKNIALKRNRPTQEVLRYYAMERFLYRLSVSNHKNSFFLKGGLMLMVWDPATHRATVDKMYLDKVKDYKSRQVEIAEQMVRHEKADHNFYVTADMVMNLAARAREIFESSEVDEKRQLLNFVFQNLKLDGKNLSIDTCEPFTTLVDYKKCPKGWGNLDLNQGPAGYETNSLGNSEQYRVNQNQFFLARTTSYDSIRFLRKQQGSHRLRKKCGKSNLFSISTDNHAKNPSCIV